MTSRTFLFECNSNTYLDCVEQNVFGSNQPWPLEIQPDHRSEMSGKALLPKLLSGELSVGAAKGQRDVAGST